MEDQMIGLNNNDDEEVDLVDENDQVIGKTLRNDVYNNSLINYRVVNAFIVNESNKIFIPVRSKDKRIFPNAFDFSIGGHVKTGETYLEAIMRESIEELNINLDDRIMNEFLYLNPYKENISSFMKIWIIKYNKEIIYNEHDFQNAKWLSLIDLEKLIQNGEKAKDDIMRVINIIRKRNLTIAST